jgi:hypothetical protein
MSLLMSGVGATSEVLDSFKAFKAVLFITKGSKKAGPIKTIC